MAAVSFTLFRYFGRQFLSGIFMSVAIIAVIIFMVDVIEMLRQYASKDKIGGAMAIQLSVLKLPNLLETVFPFAFLFGAMWTFSRLSRSNELVVARASGVSAWQFLAPAVAIALLTGTFMVTVYNPASAVMLARYSVLEKTLLRGEDSRLSLAKTGLWLREAQDGNHRVVHALSVDDSSDGSLRINDVIMFGFEGRTEFADRIDARSAELQEGEWHLTDVWTWSGDGQPRFYDRLTVPTAMSPKRIQESFASPETLPFWELRDFIETAREAGFSVNRHRFHWHALVSTPFLLTAMVFLAATFSLRQSRFGGVVRLLIAGVLAGFGLFFISDVAGALGQSGIMPPALAAWGPTVVTALLGLAILFHLEDG